MQIDKGMKPRLAYILILLVISLSCDKDNDERRAVRCSFQFIGDTYKATSANCNADYDWYYGIKDYTVSASGDNFSILFLEHNNVNPNGQEILYSRSIRLFVVDVDSLYSYWGTDAFIRSGKSVSFEAELLEFYSRRPAGLITGYCACSSGKF